MADRYPLVVDSSNQNIKELPDGDSLLLGDSEKIRFGDGQDLNLYHDGSNSYLANRYWCIVISNRDKWYCDNALVILPLILQ